MAEKIIKLYTDCGKWTLYKETNSSKYSLVYSGKIIKYWNNGSEVDGDYLFYRDVGLGVIELVRLIRYLDCSRWFIYKHLNTYRHKYSEDDDWTLQSEYDAYPQ